MKRKIIISLAICSIIVGYNHAADVHNNNSHNTIKVFASASPIQAFFSPEFFEKSTEHIKTHKYKYVVSGITALYSGLATYLTYAYYVMHDQKRWNNWYEGVSFKKLIQIPKDVLYKQLQQEIERRYDSPNVTIVMNLTQFLRETANEINILRHYASIGSWICTFKINLAFLVTSASVKDAQQKAQRLCYLRTIIANELEPKNITRRLNLINAYRKIQALMQRALNRRH